MPAGVANGVANFSLRFLRSLRSTDADYKSATPPRFSGWLRAFATQLHVIEKCKQIIGTCLNFDDKTLSENRNEVNRISGKFFLTNSQNIIPLMWN